MASRNLNVNAGIGLGIFSGGVLLWVLYHGPTSGQVGAGSLTAVKGQSVTDSRASNKTCNIDGGVVILSSNQPCVDTVGLNVEGSATNSLIRSQAQATVPWVTATGSTITNNVILFPDGVNGAARITSTNAAAAQHQVSQPVTTTAATWTFSVYAKAGTYNWLALNWNSAASVVADLSAGILYNPVGVSASGITAVGSGWYRIYISFTATAASTNFIIGYGDNQADADPNGGATPSYTDSGGGTIYVSGAQAETGSPATSYVFTITSAATRSADDARVTNTLSANPGTWCVAATVVPLLGAWPTTAGILAAGTAAAANTWALSLTSTGTPTFSVYDATPAQKVFTASSTISAASHRLQACDTAGTLTIAVDGTAVAGSTTGAGTGTLASQPATLLLGETAVSGTNPLWGELYSICQGTSSAGCH